MAPTPTWQPVAMTRTTTTKAIAAAAATGALLLGSCGSSGGSAKATITKAQFLARADEICSSATKDLQAAEQKAQTQDLDEAGQEKFVTDTLLPNIESQIDAMRTLGSPKGDEATLKKILDGADAKVAEIKADPKAFISSNADPFAAVNKEMAAYGLKSCGSSS